MRKLLLFILSAGLSLPLHAQVQCWASMEEQDQVASPKLALIRKALLEAEQIVRRNAEFMAAPVPVRMRTTISAGPDLAAGGRLLVRAYPEQTSVGIRLWTGKCDIIPQAERVAGSIGQVDIFLNYDVQGHFLAWDGPKLTGRVAGYPEYNHWVVVAKGGRLPWIARTLEDQLNAENGKLEKALKEWNYDKAHRSWPDEKRMQQAYESMKKTDPAGAEKFRAAVEASKEALRKMQEKDPLMDAALQKEIDGLHAYRASFSREALQAPGVWGDPSGEGQRKLDALIQQLHQLPPDGQAQVDAWNREGRELERQAQLEARNGRPQESERLRAQVSQLALKARAVRQEHDEKASWSIRAASFEYRLRNLKPGDPDKAMGYKTDPALPDFKEPNRIQLITVLFPPWQERGPATPRTAWMERVKNTFDFAALAALLQ